MTTSKPGTGRLVPKPGSVRRARSRTAAASRRILMLLMAWPLPCILLCALTGCVTKGKADARAREAFEAGQRQGMARMQQQMQAPSVTVLGEVKNSLIPWTEDLTLAKAILAAGYSANSDPTDIVIVRNGQATQVDPKKLLSGEDVPLLNHDVVAIRR